LPCDEKSKYDAGYQSVAMQLSWETIQANASAFSKEWEDAKDEKSEAQPFLTAFFQVFGIPSARRVGRFERAVLKASGTTCSIDYFWAGQIAIEMKSLGKSLDEAFTQLQDYMKLLPSEDVPDLWMVCDFETIRLFRPSTNSSFEFLTKDLHKHVSQFSEIAGYDNSRVTVKLVEANAKASGKMADLHNALKKYGYSGHDLEVYLVRLLFCMFADSTGIFPQRNFHWWVAGSRSEKSDLSARLSQLFEILDMPPDVRATKPLLSNELKAFRYINGKLFHDKLPFADFDVKMRDLLKDCTEFDWSKISPAIFGSMFQGVMDKEDKEKRRDIGAHYTSEENILKLINPLFMDELWKEFEEVKSDPKALERFHNKIARLKFLDPACGCGNFLIIAYRELRLLEIEILMAQKNSFQMALDLKDKLKVSIEQFYGIELEDFPCQVAMVGMWLIDHQMNLLVSEQFGQYIVNLPLTKSATIVQGNALRLDWESIGPKNELSYILGNPPFIGGMMMSREQKSDMVNAIGDTKGVGELDYVCGWYHKASNYMKGTRISTAFVSTNSVAQGQQAVTLWKPLFEAGIRINYAYRTFKWNNEAKGKAAVHCVIIGFAFADAHEKYIFDGAEKIKVKQINSYLVEAPITLVESRSNPIGLVPQMRFGSMPRDGGGFVLTDEEKIELVTKEPLAEKWIRQYLGSYEFINSVSRWCLWLVDADPNELRQCRLVMNRVEGVRQFRANSVAAETRRFASTPTLFCQIAQPNTEYVLIPRVSSENRYYIPMGIVPPDVIASDAVQIIPGATSYHFGILTSSVHMAWVRAVCGRLKSDLRYSKDIVYNNFPWPGVTDSQKAEIEKLAQAVLDARALFPNSSLADLYDPLAMPPELLRAHKALDRAVMKLYGFHSDMSEASLVVALMERYRVLVEAIGIGKTTASKLQTQRPSQ